ncbi:hypothetical protein SRB5_49220 [Streptomyces sp. RB5]|uniref:Protein kinase domain-containing protein n=1 Tax=Streptomyces smaragdinus TaxID=2585196 RepID=A0A7K0CMP5_9ACTN|nr:protein kinase family protein [Streptomyces smaragdinus]MQY14746.1 hypothetical protein [Streptomyces smaragdinus]
MTAPPPTGSAPGRAARLAAHRAVAASLTGSGDGALADLLDTAVPLGSGIGGTSALLEVAGTPVFVKRVPLTDLERRPEHVRSTANLFGLPGFCHYGVGAIGGPGFGAWRELAAHAMTTDWVLAGGYEGFPLLYHWRVVPGTLPLPEELADVERAVAYWGGGEPVRRRIEALRDAPATIALFLEYIPHNLHQWLSARIDAGDGADFVGVERELAAGIAYMNDRGLLHFDAHFENILTDGRRLYFTDFGLAVSSAFELAPDEADFVDRHRDYDRAHTTTYLVNWLITALYGFHPADREARHALVQAVADGERPTGVPDEVAALLTRHAPVAALMSGFSLAFRHRSRRVPCPTEEIGLLYKNP